MPTLRSGQRWAATSGRSVDAPDPLRPPSPKIRTDKRRYMERAAVMVRALRELDEETRDAGYKNNFALYADAAWQAMIDSILSTQPQEEK